MNSSIFASTSNDGRSLTIHENPEIYSLCVEASVNLFIDFHASNELGSSFERHVGSKRTFIVQDKEVCLNISLVLEDPWNRDVVVTLHDTNGVVVSEHVATLSVQNNEIELVITKEKF